MYDWPDDLVAELSNNPTTLCKLFSVTPLVGTAIYFTDADQDIVVGDITYHASHSFQPSAIENSIGGSNSNLTLTVLFGDGDGEISYADAQMGFYQGAVVTVSLASYANIAAGVGLITAGKVGQFALPSKLYGTMSITGNTGKMDRTLTEVYQPTCRANFGDSRCTIDLMAHSHLFTVDSAADDSMTFVSDTGSRGADGFYNLGTITWSGGANEGFAQEVTYSLATGEVGLFYPPPFAIQAADAGRIYQGCALTLAACTAYDNVPNFRGEPYVPGDDYKQVT